MMNRSMGKARSSRKQRLEGAHKGRAARPSGRVPRVVKARGAAAVPVPANDTALDLRRPDPELAETVASPELLGAPLDAESGEEHALLAPGAGVPEELEIAGAADAAVEEVDPEADVEADADSEETDEIDTELAAGAVGKKKRGEDEPASFLAMYFRDMAELDVLRPEQEFETARKIEELELDLWRTLLGFASGADWIGDTIEKAVGKPMPEVKAYRVAAEKARHKASIPARSRFEKAAAELSLKLRAIDIDRIFLDASLGEIQRIGRATEGLPFEGHVSFSTSTRVFKTYVKTVRQKAHRLKAAKNEFVKANLRLVVSIARRFNHGRLPLADLIQEGNIGLMKAVERYDYRRGFRFSTYASWWIRHAISRALADKGRAVRLPVHMIDAYHRIAKSQRELQSKLERPPSTQEIAAATGIEAEKLEKMKTFLSETPVSLDRPISDDDGRRLIDVLVDPNEGPGVPDQMVSTETQSEMLRLLGGLKPIEADILRKRFGLLNDRERTLKEIGDEYSLSRERVRQLQEQALGKMRRAMAKREML
jgi:RNA polymerase primary sigma factor